MTVMRFRKLSKTENKKIYTLFKFVPFVIEMDFFILAPNDSITTVSVNRKRTSKQETDR